MKLIALCGAAGAGKDTVADMLPARKLAFADALYAEVADAWGVREEDLRARTTKEVPSIMLPIVSCKDFEFCAFKIDDDWSKSRSPRQILQWWGDYRRAQDPHYFVKATLRAMPPVSIGSTLVITDCRFPNEVAMVRQLGGDIWQVVRPGVTAGATGHASDNDGSQFSPDRVIQNSGSLEDLRLALAAVVQEAGC